MVKSGLVIIAIASFFLASFYLSIRATNSSRLNNGLRKEQIIAVINTPKCGTNGLTQTFIKSLRCRHRNVGIKSESTGYRRCRHGGGVIRTHDFERGREALKEVRPDSTIQKCTVITSVRHPEHWLPSVFLQSRTGGHDLCDADITREEYFQRYHDWLMTDYEMEKVRKSVNSVRPGLLEAFGGSILSYEMKKIEANGGYSLLENPLPNDVFNNCKLLLLRMEDSDKWQKILYNIVPGVRYSETVSRVEKCPKTADHYRALQEYHLSFQEIVSVVGMDLHMLDYFNAYGILSPKARYMLSST
mmetsp:Transcript_21032/g.32332  ORF Transcript_21032/g.32332 Transcript_21032/m.32332 type:complete len:302 (+) Transcript_21032:285-1190(+)